MKKNIFSLFVIILCNNVFAQSNDPFISYRFINNSENCIDTIKNNGIIKEQVYLYDLKNRPYIDYKKKPYTILQKEILYNNEGNITQIRGFLDKNIITEKYSYKFIDGNHLKNMFIKIYANNNLVVTTEIEYDSLGRELNFFSYNNDTSNLYVKHKEYNNNNQLIAILEKRNLEELYVSTRFYYDDNGSLTNVHFFNSTNQLIYSKIYQLLNDEGNKLIVSLKNIKETILREGEYIYGADNKLMTVSRDWRCQINDDLSYYSDVHLNFYNNPYPSNPNYSNPDYSNPYWGGYYGGNFISYLQNPFSPKGNNIVNFGMISSFSRQNAIAVWQNMPSSQPMYYSSENTTKVKEHYSYTYNVDGTIAQTDYAYGYSKTPITSKFQRHYYFKK